MTDGLDCIIKNVQCLSSMYNWNVSVSSSTFSFYIIFFLQLFFTKGWHRHGMFDVWWNALLLIYIKFCLWISSTTFEALNSFLPSECIMSRWANNLFGTPNKHYCIEQLTVLLIKFVCAKVLYLFLAQMVGWLVWLYWIQIEIHYIRCIIHISIV